MNINCYGKEDFIKIDLIFCVCVFHSKLDVNKTDEKNVGKEKRGSKNSLFINLIEIYVFFTLRWFS